jgi:hypothetical protein
MMDDAEMRTWAHALESSPTFVRNFMQGILKELNINRTAARMRDAEEHTRLSRP